jgi:hypothetical protein
MYIDEYQQDLEELITLYKFTESIINSNLLDWSEKYEIIFSNKCWSKIVSSSRALGISFNYCNPDGSYEDDCRAFFNHFKEMNKKVEHLNDLLNKAKGEVSND